MLRRFAFERFADFEPKIWADLHHEAAKRAKLSLPFVIEGADRHEGALSLAHRWNEDSRDGGRDARQARPHNPSGRITSTPKKTISDTTGAQMEPNA